MQDAFFSILVKVDPTRGLFSHALKADTTGAPVIDSHCHLADEVFAADLDAVVDRARAAGVETVLAILAAGDEKEASQARRLEELWPHVRFAIGVHPHQAGGYAGDAAPVVDLVSKQAAS